MSGPPWYGTMAAPYIMAALQTLADYSTIRQHCRLGLLCSNCSLYRADFLHWRTKYQQAVCLQQDMIKVQHCCVHHIECCCWCAVCARQSAILFLVGRQLLIGRGDISLTHCCQPTNKKKTSRTKFVQGQWLKLLKNGLKTRKKEITNTQNITLQLVLMSFLWTSLTKVFVNISLASESLSLKPVGRELVRLITASKHLLVSHRHKTQEDTMTHVGGLSVPLLTMTMMMIACLDYWC